MCLFIFKYTILFYYKLKQNTFAYIYYITVIILTICQILSKDTNSTKFN